MNTSSIWPSVLTYAAFSSVIALNQAMTLENAAYVRTVGQIELVFSLLASTIVFKERSSRYEILGMLLIVLGIVILLAYR